jgi:hypothetical protein
MEGLARMCERRESCADFTIAYCADVTIGQIIRREPYADYCFGAIVVPALLREGVLGNRQTQEVATAASKGS